MMMMMMMMRCTAVRLNKENVHSRAYIAFKTEEYVAKFSREYDGHIFKDKAGMYMRNFVSMLREAYKYATS
jgi:Smg-4/UPF3 family